MPVYDKVQGAWRELDKAYDKVQGVWRETDKIYHKVQGVWRECYSSGIPLSSVPIGSYVNVVEPNRGVRRYLVLSHNYSSSGRVLILRERTVENMYWRDNPYSTPLTYENSSLIHYNLKSGGELYNSLFVGSNIQGYLQPVSIRTTATDRQGEPGSDRVYCNTIAFILSASELFQEDRSDDGVWLPYFSSNSSRITYNDAGAQVRWWTRTAPYADFMVYVRDWDGGKTSMDGGKNMAWVRPATTLPPNLLVSSSPVANGGYDILG